MFNLCLHPSLKICESDSSCCLVLSIYKFHSPSIFVSIFRCIILWESVWVCIFFFLGNFRIKYSSKSICSSVKIRNKFYIKNSLDYWNSIFNPFYQSTNIEKKYKTSAFGQCTIIMSFINSPKRNNEHSSFFILHSKPIELIECDGYSSVKWFIWRFFFFFLIFILRSCSSYYKACVPFFLILYYYYYLTFNLISFSSYF